MHLMSSLFLGEEELSFLDSIKPTKATTHNSSSYESSCCTDEIDVDQAKAMYDEMHNIKRKTDIIKIMEHLIEGVEEACRAGQEGDWI